jgi:hypothetical protein
VNQNLQKHGVCWLYAATATLVAARDPDLVGRLLTGRIQSYGSGEEINRSGFPNEFVRKVLQLLLDVTTGAGMVVGKQLVSRLVVRDGLRRWLKKFSKDQTLIDSLDDRIIAVLESTEEERGIKFSPNFAMGVIKCYADQLSKKIQDTNSRVTRAQPELGLGEDDKGMKHILALYKIEAFQELELEMVDYLRETKFVAAAPRRNWWQNLTSRFLSMFGAPPAGQIIYWDPENRPSGKYAPWTEGNPGQPATRLGQGNGELEVLATEAATQALDHSLGNGGKSFPWS